MVFAVAVAVVVDGILARFICVFLYISNHPSPPGSSTACSKADSIDSRPSLLVEVVDFL